MKIMCKLHRPNGTQVTLDGETYDFQPDEYGRHVCIVESEKHQDVFLGIPEGYRPLIEDAAPAKVEGTVPAETQTLAPGASGDEDEDDSGSEPEQEQEPEPEKAPDPEQDGEDEEIDLEKLDDATLDKVYEEVMGKKPNGRAKRETLIAHIVEKVGS